MRYNPNVVLVKEPRKILYNVMPPLGVYIQHVNGNTYTTDEWTEKGFANDAANGVAVVADEAKFVIAKDNVSTSVAWSSNTSTLINGILTSTDSTEAKTDFAGQQNTELMLTVDTSGAGYSCANYTFPNGSKGYLPALGEWDITYQNSSAINKAMRLIGGTTLSSWYWSSTQYSAYNAWSMRLDNGSTDYSNKSYDSSVRAFSALTI